MLDKIFSSFNDFKSNPISYIMFVVVVGFGYNLYTTSKDKTEQLNNCQEEQKRLNRRFEDIVFKKEKVEANDSTIVNLKDK